MAEAESHEVKKENQEAKKKKAKIRNRTSVPEGICFIRQIRHHALLRANLAEYKVRHSRIYTSCMSGRPVGGLGRGVP